MQTRRRVRPLTEVVIDMHAAGWDSESGLSEFYPSPVPHPAEQQVDLVDMPAWARRHGLVDPGDLSTLVEYYYAREFRGAGHAHAAQVFAVDERTSKRRCSRALQALRAAAPMYLAG